MSWDGVSQRMGLRTSVSESGETSTSGRPLLHLASMEAARHDSSLVARAAAKRLENAFTIGLAMSLSRLQQSVEEHRSSLKNCHAFLGKSLHTKKRRATFLQRAACMTLDEGSSFGGLRPAGQRIGGEQGTEESLKKMRPLRMRCRKGKQAMNAESLERMDALQLSTKAKVKEAVNTTKHLFAGALSACVARTCVAPLERLKLEYIVRGAKQNVGTTIVRILKSEGVAGFWQGNAINLLRTAPFKSINFFAFDIYKKKIIEFSKRHDLSNSERGLAGAAAGVTATILCFPMDTIRTRMIAQGEYFNKGVGGCFLHIVRNDGVLALYRGLLPALLSMAPAGAVFYGVYDWLKQSYLKSPKGQLESELRLASLQAGQGSTAVGNTINKMELGPLRTLLFGAISGACAETTIYPLEVVRRQLQLQSLAGANLGLRNTFLSIIKKGGPLALYVGWLPSTLQVLPSAALSYFVYELAKTRLQVI